MTRSNKTISIFVTTAVAVTSALFYCGWKKYKKYKKLQTAVEIKELGNKLFKEKKYEAALQKYFEAEKYTDKNDKEHLNILNNISLIHFLMRNFTEALAYTEKYLSIEKKNVKILKRRFDINKTMENDTETVTDAFILSILDPQKHSSLGKNTLNSVVERQTEERLQKSDVFPGKINILEFFETFPDISRIYYNSQEQKEELRSTEEFEDAESEKQTKQENKKLGYDEYKKIYLDYKSTSSASLFIRASIEHLLGNNEKAFDLIKKDIFYYSVILREYISVYLGEVKRTKEFIKLTETMKSDFSVLFYNTLIALQSHNMKYQSFLEKGLESYPLQFTVLKLVFLIQSKDYSAVEITLQSITVFSLPICAIACEYYLMVKKYAELSNLISEMVKIDENDPRISLFRGMMKDALEKEGVEQEFFKCIDIDSTFVKPYILLGNYLMKKNRTDCEKYFEQALDLSYQREDIDACLRSILLWNVQKRCIEKYPELFKES